MKSRIILGSGLLIAALSATASTPDLPKVEILGKEYYYHEIKKGETPYGIANKYGWNLDELVRLNPATISDMEKGSRLYYPTGRVTVVTDFQPKEEENVTAEEAEPIRHLVKRGETVYSISRQYNVPVDSIYKYCPDSKYKIKAGETLVFPQPDTDKASFTYYEIKPGDTLFALAKKYGVKIGDIEKWNPGLSENNFRSGATIRIKNVSEENKEKRVKTILVEEERLASIDSYKVGKKEDWEKISEKTGVAVETLKDANDNLTNPKKNDVVNIPVFETVQVEREIEDMPEDLELTNDSIVSPLSEPLDEVNVALLLEDASGKKDLEFTRGFLTALDGMRDLSYKVNFKVLEGKNENEKILEALDEFRPNLVVVTADKSFPAYLAEYGNKNDVDIINVFDIKNDLSEENPSMVQLLPTSLYFNQQVGEQLATDYGNRKIITVGDKDSGDGIAEVILTQLSDKKIENVAVSNLSDYNVTGDGEYLFYCYPTRKADVADIMQAFENIRRREPFADIVVVGRPNWITLYDTYGDKFGESGVIVPSRVWFDVTSTPSKNFIRSFKALFGSTPIKSFPNFAASGYDVANYFIPFTAATGGDLDNITGRPQKEMLQSDVRLERVSNWGGLINGVSYLLRFRAGGYIEKIMLK